MDHETWLKWQLKNEIWIKKRDLGKMKNEIWTKWLKSVRIQFRYFVCFVDPTAPESVRAMGAMPPLDLIISRDAVLS